MLIQNLTKKFKTTHGILTVLDNYSLNVKEGVFLGIQGKSGAGKSTLLSLIAGLQKPDSGSIIINGTEITTLGEKQLAAFRNKNIGFISQEQSFLDNLTVFDNVRLPSYILNNYTRQNNEQIIERANYLLKELGIEHLANQYPSVLSGGENHRVLIARALINNPELILADEPTDSVDEERTADIIKIFRNLADQGKTVIMVSHDCEALRLCDSINLV